MIHAAKRTPDFIAKKIVEEGVDVKAALNENIDFEVTEEEIKAVKEALESAEEDEKVKEVDNAIEAMFNGVGRRVVIQVSMCLYMLMDRVLICLQALSITQIIRRISSSFRGCSKRMKVLRWRIRKHPVLLVC